MESLQKPPQNSIHEMRNYKLRGVATGPQTLKPNPFIGSAKLRTFASARFSLVLTAMPFVSAETKVRIDVWKGGLGFRV